MLLNIKKMISWESVKTFASFAKILEGYGKEYDSYFDTHYSGAKIVRMNDGSLRRSKAT